MKQRDKSRVIYHIIIKTICCIKFHHLRVHLLWYTTPGWWNNVSHLLCQRNSENKQANNVTQYCPITIWNFQVILNWRWEARNLDDLDSASAVLYLQALMPGCWQACLTALVWAVCHMFRLTELSSLTLYSSTCSSFPCISSSALSLQEIEILNKSRVIQYWAHKNISLMYLKERVLFTPLWYQHIYYRDQHCRCALKNINKRRRALAKYQWKESLDGTKSMLWQCLKETFALWVWSWCDAICIAAQTTKVLRHRPRCCQKTGEWWVWEWRQGISNWSHLKTKNQNLVIPRSYTNKVK